MRSAINQQQQQFVTPDVPADELLRRVANLEASLQVDVKKQATIQYQTQHQGKNQQWFSERQQRITASFAGKIFSLRSTTDNIGLISQILGHGNHSSFSNVATRYGSEQESIARDAYSSLTKLSVSPSGLVVSIESGILAASPDGLVGEDGLVEIKCPFSIQYEDPNNWTTSPSPLMKASNGKPKLRESHAHYLQEAMQIHVTGRQWCDYFMWTKRGFYLQRITKKETLVIWHQLKAKLEAFWRNELAPEIVDSRHARGIKEYRCPPSRLVGRQTKQNRAKGHKQGRRMNLQRVFPQYGSKHVCSNCGESYFSMILFRTHIATCVQRAITME